MQRVLTTDRQQLCDMLRVTFPGCSTPVYDAFLFAFALIADHDLLQESTLRGLDPAIKNVYCPLHCIAMNRLYRARVYIRPVELSAEERRAKWYRDAGLLPLADGDDVARCVKSDIVGFSSALVHPDTPLLRISMHWYALACIGTH